MKKRTLTIVAVLAAVSMLSFAVFANNDMYEGYERFKELMTQEEAREDYGQGYATLKIIDNDSELISISGEFIGSKLEDGSGSLQIDSKDLSKSLEVYKKDQTMYLVDGDTVYLANHVSEKENRKMKEHKDFSGHQEALMDFFMADLKDDFTMDGDNIVFELNKEEIPALLNIIASSENDHREDNQNEKFQNYPLFNELKVIKDLVPELTNKEIEYVKVTFIVEDNKLVGLESTFSILGYDQNSNSHLLEVQALIEKTSTNQNVRTFELTDETVYEIETER